MPTIINGSTNAITFPDSTIQNTSAIVSGKVPYTNLPAGSVLQVINASYTTQTSNSTNSFADTGLSASITPRFATSRILVLADIGGVYKDSNSTIVWLNLLRGSTVISGMERYGAFTGNTNPMGVASSSISFLDSPATTSATTYRVQFASGANNLQAVVQTAGSTSTLTLLEIAG
jgi:hypothetical protein